MTMNDAFLQKLEEAALNAYPAPHQLIYDGWLLRFLGGPSKRVNSVNVLYPSTLPLKEKVVHCEREYTRHGLPVIFRVPDPFASDALNKALQGCGYVQYDPTFVLGQKIEVGIFGVTSKPEMREMSISDWMHLRAYVGGVPFEKIAYLETILKVIVPEKYLMGCFVENRPVACGIGVREGDFLGYFSIYTYHDERRKGYARTVMSALTDCGVEKGASYGYLQVEGDNAPARALYQDMGFETCYRYVYWKKG
jgi:GNAT superfamily N-acetyltransferase